jgi:hypothetical protein
VTTLPSVQVTDAFGNPINGIEVTFELLQTAPSSPGQRDDQHRGNRHARGWTIGPDAQVHSPAPSRQRRGPA